jgi:hypothetical protein
VSAIDFKREHELRTFQQFCDAAALRIVPDTVRQPDPPAPDLIAELEGNGRVAFELVRLNDPDQLTRLSPNCPKKESTFVRLRPDGSS